MLLAATACAAVLAGCAAPGPGPDAALTSRTANPARPVFATQLAGPSTFLAPMPTAVVVLKPDDLNRNRAFCASVTSRLPTAQQALADTAVAPNLVLTRWLVQLQDVPADRANDCDFLVGTYDYARAARLIGAVRLSQGQLSGPGPFLLMVSRTAPGCTWPDSMGRATARPISAASSTLGDRRCGKRRRRSAASRTSPVWCAASSIWFPPSCGRRHGQPAA